MRLLLDLLFPGRIYKRTQACINHMMKVGMAIMDKPCICPISGPEVRGCPAHEAFEDFRHARF